MRRFPLYLQILVALAAGAAAGLVFGAATAPLGEIGRLVIQLIKTFAVPLLFFAILDAFIRSEISARSAGAMVGISMINATIALAVGMGLSNWLKPGLSLVGAVTAGTAPAKAVEKLDWMKTLSGYIPENLVKPFAENSIITVILIAVFGGLALRRVKKETSIQTVEDLVHTLYRATSVLLEWIIRLVPLAVFGVVAKVVGTQGFAPFSGLMVYVGVVLLGLAIQVALVYQTWLLAVAKVSLRWFWTGARDAVAYALGASSSLATLPVTLRSLQKMNVSERAARLAACVGTNLNNDGILLYEAMAVLIVAQAHGIELDLGQQILAAVSCAVAGIGIAGVPDAGLISLSIVLATVGLPLELLPLLLTVDWILSRARATTNVISDLVVAVVLDRGGRGARGHGRPAS